MGRLLPALAVLAAATAFLPVLRDGWVGWDDPLHFLENPYYRGLGWAQLRWMFQGPHLGQYFPLAWVTLGLDYVLWGMEPFGYHLTNLLLHAASAGVFYAVSLRLLALGAPKATEDERRAAAVAAALAFAVHPLRVESVAWITERRDVLSGFFYLLAVWLYLRSCAARAPGAVRWRAASLAVFAASLLSKAMGMTLPAALLLLDVYPLQRLPPDPRRWTDEKSRAVLIEKIPFALLSAAAFLAAWAALKTGPSLQGVGAFGLAPRLAEASYGVLFYLWKTVWPFGLIPLYEEPAVIRLADPRFAVCVVGAAALAGGIWASRKRFPAVLAAGLFYALTLAPVSGLVRNGIPHLALDRYCYLPSLGLSLLIGSAVLAGLRRHRFATLCATVALFVFWGALSWRQSGFWRDSIALWGHTLDVDPGHEVGHKNMAVALAERGDFQGAEAHARRAVQLGPGDYEAHDDLGAVLLRLGRPAEAEASFAKVAALRPDFALGQQHWGVSLAAQGRLAEAAVRFREALRLDDSDGASRFALGSALAALGRKDEAAAEFRRVLRDDPDFAPARLDWGLLLAGSGHSGEAAEQYRLALRSRSEAAAANYDLGNLLSDRGDLTGAARRYREAVRLRPDMLAARFNLGNTLARLGRFPEAAAEYRAVLARDPNYVGARANLALSLSRR